MSLVAYKSGPCFNCQDQINQGSPFAWAKNAPRGARVHVDCEAFTFTDAELNPQPKPAAVPDNRVWSDFQTAIFNAMADDSVGSFMVDAGPGCAKSSTIEEGARRYPNKNTVIKYIVFARKNADEAKERMPDNVDPSTFHSCCNSALMRRLNPRPKLDKNKVYTILKIMIQGNKISEITAEQWGDSLVKLVGLAKNEGIGCIVPDEPEEWNKIIDHHELIFESVDNTRGYGSYYGNDEYAYEEDTLEGNAEAIELARTMLYINNELKTVIDYDDMLYFTVLLNVAIPKYDIICVDEAQDTNPIQRAILRKMLAPGGRLIAVGDPNQAIYGFRGASSDAMELLAHDFGMSHLPLSVNYRCSKAVIRATNEYMPELQYHDGAPEGSVEHLQQFNIRNFQPTDAILSRTTAPLISLAYRLMKSGIGCQVLGRDIGAGLISLVNQMSKGKKGEAPITQLPVMLDRLSAYAARSIERYMAKGQEEKAQALDDKVNSILAAVESLPETEQSVPGLCSWIKHIFSDEQNTARITLATVHKSKGLEWPRVFILDPQNMPSKWARQEWQRKQERNLIVVAMTRAKVDLRYIRSVDIR